MPFRRFFLNKKCVNLLLLEQRTAVKMWLFYSHFLPFIFFPRKAENCLRVIVEREQCVGNAGVTPATFLFAFFPSVPFFSPPLTKKLQRGAARGQEINDF